MSISRTVEKAINDQIKEELYSAYLYLSMSAWFAETSLNGFANWMYIQYQEEVTHAMKFYRYLIERGGTVKLQAIAQPDSEFDSALEIYQATLKHEQFITSKINELVDIARKENDNATLNMLQWFVDEQVEEEANASELVDKLTLVGDNNASLFMIDKDLSARVFVDETVSG